MLTAPQRSGAVHRTPPSRKNVRYKKERFWPTCHPAFWTVDMEQIREHVYVRSLHDASKQTFCQIFVNKGARKRLNKGHHQFPAIKGTLIANRGSAPQDPEGDNSASTWVDRKRLCLISDLLPLRLNARKRGISTMNAHCGLMKGCPAIKPGSRC